MAEVSITINGRQFRMACEDGQEEHLMDLARELDARIGDLRERFGEVGDTRLTVMAALTVADELGEMSARLKRLEEELAGLRDAHVATADRTSITQTAIAATLTEAAERIESVTRRLNQTIGGGSVPLG